MTRWASPLDALFLIGESPTTVMHVGSLMPFTPPPAAGADFVGELLTSALAAPVAAPWNLRLRSPSLMKSPVNQWVPDPDLDLGYHVRHSRLPAPGGERELGVLVSRLHSHQLDFSRPPWEMHVIEGLEGGRFALYVKIHHALLDGFTGMRLLARSLSPDPEATDQRFFFSVPTGSPRPTGDGTQASRGGLTDVAAALPGLVGGALGSAGSVTKAWLGTQLGSADHPALVSSHAAPDSLLNRRTGRNRRFATQQLELDRFVAVGKAGGGTVNDVLVAICGGSLRRYLLDQDALPRDPLIAFLPVNVRAKDASGGGNQVGATLVSLATDVADPAERFERVVDSTSAAKARMEGMTREEIVAYSGLLLAPAVLQLTAAVSGLPLPVPHTFNLCISNVPGPATPLFLRRARMEATYPVSIVGHSMGLNITAHSYAGMVDIGFLGCRDSVPRLQNIAVYAGAALTELERAYGVR